MADLPAVNPVQRTTITLPVRSYWKDHHILGRAVLSAVEALQALALQALQLDPLLAVHRMTGARFAKFLEIDPTLTKITVYCDLFRWADGGLGAALISKVKGPASGILRTLEHAYVDFARQPPVVQFPAPERVTDDQGLGHTVTADRIYTELVPFGPAFRSIKGELTLSPSGAWAEIWAPDQPLEDVGPLGSSFPLDGAFHAACVWGQVYAGVVAFPVGIDQRIIVYPTQPLQSYRACIEPVQFREQPLVFNIYLLDSNRQLRETVQGVKMRDVSRGRWKPPDGVFQQDSRI